MDRDNNRRKTTIRKEGARGSQTTNRRPAVKKRKRGFLFYLKAILNNIKRNLKKLFLSNDRKRNLLTYYIFGILILMIIVFFMTKKNAYAVYLQDTFICNLKFDKTLEPSRIESLAISKLKSEVGTNVKVSEAVSLKKVHSSKKELNTEEFAANEIYKKYTYLIEASEIVVEGKPLVLMKNETEANEVIEKIIGQYVGEGIQTTEKSIIQDYNLEKRFVNTSDVVSVDEAFKILTLSNKIEKEYSVVSGDTLYAIAIRNGTTAEELKELNPGLTEKIKIGQIIKIVSNEPILSVQTVEEIKEEKPIPKIVENKENPTKPQGYKRTIQEGKDGVQEISTKIFKINGVETKRETTQDGKIISAPVNEIIEIGTN